MEKHNNVDKIIVKKKNIPTTENAGVNAQIISFMERKQQYNVKIKNSLMDKIGVINRIIQMIFMVKHAKVMLIKSYAENMEIRNLKMEKLQIFAVHVEEESEITILQMKRLVCNNFAL